MYVCVSEYVHDWQIHGRNVNEISIAIFIRNHTILNDVMSNNEAYLDALLIVTTSFHLCELKRIKRTFPMIRCKCTVLL